MISCLTSIPLLGLFRKTDGKNMNKSICRDSLIEQSYKLLNYTVKYEGRERQSDRQRINIRNEIQLKSSLMVNILHTISF